MLTLELHTNTGGQQLLNGSYSETRSRSETR